MTINKDPIGTFYGKPISKMSKKRLIELILWLSKENESLRKELYRIEDNYTDLIFSN